MDKNKNENGRYISKNKCNSFSERLVEILDLVEKEKAQQEGMRIKSNLKKMSKLH